MTARNSNQNTTTHTDNNYARDIAWGRCLPSQSEIVRSAIEALKSDIKKLKTAQNA